MKHLLAVIVAVVGLVAVVTGCGGSPRYDARLVAADSLMHDLPDSALALVLAVDTASLPREGDRAYRDLLLTQARYRCYITATSDSAINRALTYYRQHDGEREKLTRAYIYKGAVMEELGHPDSAMLYYKHAEATASPTDYFNLGYCNMRMGALYRDHYSMDGKHIEKYEDALKYLMHTNETHFQIKCMINLGSIYRLKMPQKSESILMKVKLFALQQKDTVQYINCLQNLIQTYYVQERYEEAKQPIQEIIGMSQGDYSLVFCTNAADVYAKLGMPDSAEYLLNLCSKSFSTVVDEMLYMESIGEIALARGDSTLYRLMDHKCKHKQDSLQALDSSMKILKAEINQDKTIQQIKSHRQQSTDNGLILIIIFLGICLVLSLYFHYRKRHRYDILISELRNETSSQLRELDALQKKIGDLGIRDNKLKDFFESNLLLVREVIEECYNTPNSKLVQRFKKIFSYQEQNRDKWIQLYEYIDIRYNNILSYTMKLYPLLNEKDLLLLSLTILDFSCVQIAMVAGYSNPTSVGAIRQRLAKKMELNCSLKQYINDYVVQHQNG